MRRCSWTCVTGSTCVETDMGGSWQLISTGFGGHTLQGSLEGAEQRAELFTIRMLVKYVLSWDDHFVQTDDNVSGTQVQTTAACSLWQKGRVEQSSRKRRTKRFGKHQVAGVSCQLRGCSRAESKNRALGILQRHECLVSKRRSTAN